MRVLGIYGSPRKGGNSDLLLEKALEGAKSAGAEVSSLRASDLDNRGCQECGGCDDTGECIVDDDMQKLYPQLDDADAIILATPIFFYAPPAQLKALIDRAQAPWNRRRLAKKTKYESGTGYLIAVGATKGKNLFQGTELIARYFFDALDMNYGGSILFSSVDEKGAIKKHPDALDQAYRLGQRAGSAEP
jgi:multimeric flavodoxin WrbA